LNRGVFIAGTDTGVGKTRVTAGLLRTLKQRGLTASGMKPIASGTMPVNDLNAALDHNRTLINEDVAVIAPLCDPACSLADINPYCFDAPVSPHIAAQQSGVNIDLRRVTAAYARLRSACEVVVVEGTGGWYAPISPEFTMADIARALALPVVLVVGLRLGCLNHALLTQQAITQSPLVFAGWIGSVLDPDMLQLDANLRTLERRLAAPCLGLLPHRPESTHDAAALMVVSQMLFS
jgi:dethiobiotin synthetase